MGLILQLFRVGQIPVLLATIRPYHPLEEFVSYLSVGEVLSFGNYSADVDMLYPPTRTLTKDSHNSPYFFRTLHTEPAPAVRAAVKTVLSCQSFALSPETVHFGCACRSTPSKSLFAKLTQINTLSIRFCRLLTLDSEIPAWIRLRLVRKSTNKCQSTTAYVRILLADNPSLLTKKLPQNVLNGFLALY